MKRKKRDAYADRPHGRWPSCSPGSCLCQAVWADQRTLIPVGKAVGIKLFADGVLVVSTSETDPCPARDCGIREGDLIVSRNGEKVTSTEDLQALAAGHRGTARRHRPAA